MPKYGKEWHEQDIHDEIKELEEARGFLARWSELSDVVYTMTRARYWSNIKSIKWPYSRRAYWWGMIYMLPKYSLRWLFFYFVGRRVDKTIKIRAVRNPRKTHKLRGIAREFGYPVKRFEETAKRWLRFWPLLK